MPHVTVPPGHTHWPLTQTCAASHCTQSRPLLPQKAVVSPGMQVPFAIALQQPFGQAWVEQIQVPFTQCWSASHCRQTPPPLPQNWSLFG